MATTYYVLDGSPKGNRLRVAMHIAVPGGNNAAGTAWQTAVAEYVISRDQGTISQVPGLSSGEQTKLDTGQLLEQVDQVEDDANAPPLERKANVEAHVTARAAEVSAELANRLQHWGESGVV